MSARGTPGVTKSGSQDWMGWRVPVEKRVTLTQTPGQSPALVDPLATLRESLDSPTDFPALWRAVTPDDHIALVVDPEMAHAGELACVVIEHIQKAGVPPTAVTLVLPRPPAKNACLEGLGRFTNEVKTEIHDATHRDRLSYLATTQKGRRVYLNRTVVDADQAIVLARRRFDWFQGCRGLAATIFPALCDDATQREMAGKPELAGDIHSDSHRRQEADEVIWLLGTPFFIQIIEGMGDDVAHVVTGVLSSASAGENLLMANWRAEAEQEADLVLATVTGTPARLGFGELAAAAAKAAYFARAGGAVVLITEAAPELDEATSLICESDSAEEAVNLILKRKPAHAGPALQWLSATARARVYLKSPMKAETVEELLATPLDKHEQIQKLIDAASSCIFLGDAHKIVAGPKAGRNPAESSATRSQRRPRSS